MTFLRIAALLLPAALVCAQGAIQLTTSGRQHADAKISPDGTKVAFRDGRSIGVFEIATRTEVVAYSTLGTTVGNFVWAPNSAGLYLTDGNQVRLVSAGGVTSSLLGTLPGSNVQVWDVDDNDLALFGTWFDFTTQRTTIFVLDTSGQSLPVDILTRTAFVSNLRLDDSLTRLLYEETQGIFLPVEFRTVDTSGGGDQFMFITGSITGSGLSDNAGSAHWLDAGTEFVFSVQSPTDNRNHIAVAGTSTPYRQLTDDFQFYRRTTRVRGGRYIVAEGLAPAGLGPSVVVVPTDGGSVQYLSSGVGLFFNNNQQTGGLTIDRNESRVAFSAGTSPGDPNMQIYMFELGNEIRVSPRLEVGQASTLEVDLLPSERFAIVGHAPDLTPGAPFQLSGFSGQFDLDIGSGTLQTIFFGIGTGSVSGTLNIPNDPNLVGVRLYFQGVAGVNARSGRFTRWGYYQVF